MRLRLLLRLFDALYSTRRVFVEHGHVLQKILDKHAASGQEFDLQVVAAVLAVCCLTSTSRICSTASRWSRLARSRLASTLVCAGCGSLLVCTDVFWSGILEHEKHEFSEMFDTAQRIMNDRVLTPMWTFRQKLWFLFPDEILLKKAVKYLDQSARVCL